MEIKIFYVWRNPNEEEAGHGICNQEKFESLKNLSPRGLEFEILFDFITREDFVNKFIENKLGNQKEAEIFLEYYKYIWD